MIHHALWLALFPEGRDLVLAKCLPRLRQGPLWVGVTG
jgi:hypothetical protein